MEQKTEPRNKPTPLWSINLKQKRRIYNGKKIISSISGARKIGELHAEDSS